MKINIKKFYIIIGIITLLVVIFLFNYNKESEISTNNISTSSLIDYPSEYNYRQTINDCGPFNTAAITRALTNKEINSEEFAKKINWRLPNNYTLPWGLEKQLEENDIMVETPNIKKFSEQEKLLYIKEQLTKKNPVIILGEKDNYQHYLTVFGFNTKNDEYYIYDSFYNKLTDGVTEDSNGDLPGNVSYNSEKLLNFWRKGGMFGLFKWYIIVASF